MSENQLVALGGSRKGYPGDPKIKGRWIVNVHGECGKSFEISVVRSDYKHGQRSYGWFDENKLLISQSFHQFTVTDKETFQGLVVLAEQAAARYNREEGRAQ